MTYYSPEWCAQTQECFSGDWHERVGQFLHMMWMHPFFAAFFLFLIIGGLMLPSR